MHLLTMDKDGWFRSSLPAFHCCGQHSGPRKALPLGVCFLFCSASEVFHLLAEEICFIAQSFHCTEYLNRRSFAGK